MYSMPIFVSAYDESVESAPSPVAHSLLLHSTLGAWHAAAFVAIALLGVPTAMPLQPASTADLGAMPTSPTEAFGLACLGLFGLAAAGVAKEVLRPTPE